MCASPPRVGLPPSGGTGGGRTADWRGRAAPAALWFWRAFCTLFNIIGHYGDTPEGEPSAGAPVEPGRGGHIMLIMYK